MLKSAQHRPAAAASLVNSLPASGPSHGAPVSPPAMHSHPPCPPPTTRFPTGPLSSQLPSPGRTCLSTPSRLTPSSLWMSQWMANASRMAATKAARSGQPWSPDHCSRWRAARAPLPAHRCMDSSGGERWRGQAGEVCWPRLPLMQLPCRCWGRRSHGRNGSPGCWLGALASCWRNRTVNAAQVGVLPSRDAWVTAQ